MAITNQQNINNVQGLFPAVGPNPTDAGGLFRLANDGSRNAGIKLAAGEGGPDFTCTALTTAAAADTVTFNITFASLLKLYVGPLVNATLAIKVKMSIVGDTAVANSSYAEIVGVFQDLVGAGNYTQLVAPQVTVTGTVVPTLGGTGTATLAVGSGATVGAVVHRIRADVFVNHIQ